MDRSQFLKVPLPARLPQAIPPVLFSRIQQVFSQFPQHPSEKIRKILEAELQTSGWTREVLEFGQERIQQLVSQLDDEKRISFRPDEERRQQEQWMREVQDAIDNVPVCTEEEWNGMKEAEKEAAETKMTQRERLRVPDEVTEKCVDVLKVELKKCCEIDEDGYVDLRTS